MSMSPQTFAPKKRCSNMGVSARQAYLPSCPVIYLLMFGYKAAQPRLAPGQELTGLKSDDGVYAIFHSAIRLVWLEKSTPILKSLRGSAAKGLA